MPAVFFSVSGSAAGKSREERREADDAVSCFLATTGWRAFEVTTFGGAIAYTKYDFLTRWLMRSLARRKGVSTDTSRDHELSTEEGMDLAIEPGIAAQHTIDRLDLSRGRRDSLKRIDGIGPLDEVTLNNLGIYHFDQIAKWTEREVLWLENHAFAVGRIAREEWQDQARELIVERDATRALR